jgi:hypothetical protein
MIKLDAYNISFMLMDAWRKFAMRSSGDCSKLGQVPTYVEVNGELLEIVDVDSSGDKIILKTK